MHRFSCAFRKNNLQWFIARNFSTKQTRNAPLQICFAPFPWFSGNSRAQCSIADCFLGKHARNAPFLMVFPESTRAIDHCRWFFRKAHEKWSISRDFFRKQTCNGSLRVIFSERTREMEHFSFALQDSRNKRKLLTAFTLFQTADYASARKAAGTRMPPAPL